MTNSRPVTGLPPAHVRRMYELEVEKHGRKASLEARVYVAKKTCVEAAGGQIGDDFETLNFTWWEGFVEHDNRKVWKAQSIHYDMSSMRQDRMYALYRKIERLGFCCDMRWPAEGPGRSTGVLYIYEEDPAKQRWGDRLKSVIQWRRK